ncbi:MAG TPA: GtrA family protein [Candidatus Limnocylindrales bacterium]|nr:GtrA family protein [Candidatus Limnocylindrales bacterium]
MKLPREMRTGTLHRWMKFNAVGAMGFLVQTAVLQALAVGWGVNYLVATALAVETAVLHNFFWHEWFTWPDRGKRTKGGTAKRLFVFHATTGIVSIGGNVLLMVLLVGWAHAPLLLGNLAAMGGCAAVNFLVNDRVVFREEGANERIAGEM